MLILPNLGDSGFRKMEWIIRGRVSSLGGIDNIYFLTQYLFTGNNIELDVSDDDTIFKNVNIILRASLQAVWS